MGTNHRGAKAQKCKTSQLLDEVFSEAQEAVAIGSFSIPNEERRMLRAQLAIARYAGHYEPLPGRSTAESLRTGIVGVSNDIDEDDSLTFTPCEERGWTSVRS